MPFAASETLSSHLGLHSRVALALASAVIDADIHQTLTPVLSSKTATAIDYVDEIINGSRNAWDEYLGHSFPKQLANDTANLNGFRHYMIQDSLYLEHYYRLRMEAVGKSGTFDDMKTVAAKIAKSLDWVSSFRKDCTDKLGVPANDVTSEDPSDALKNSIKLHTEVLTKGDWLDVHIVLLPCILGYDAIASKLLYDSETIRNTIYYPLWIQANVGGSAPKEYRKFINESIKNLPDGEWEKRRDGWIKNFTRACDTEKAFFDLGIPTAANQVPAYKILKNAIYKIRSYRTNYSLVARPDFSVETSVKPTEGAWRLTNSVDGYSIESVAGQNGWLDVPTGDLTQPVYAVTVSQSDPKLVWPINTVVVYDEKGPHQAFQIYLPGRTEFVLDAGRSVNTPKVFMTNNCLSSNQLWLIEYLTD